MAMINRYYASVLLLLGFVCPLSQPFPVTAQGPITEQCVFYARSLLQNITDTLSQKQLFSGFDCEKQRVDLHLDTNTTSACAPKGIMCSGVTKSEFNQESCLRNIREDLRHYYKFLTGQFSPESSLRTSLLLSLKELTEKCFTRSESEDLTSETAAADRPRSYDERLRLCKVLRGFQIRTITINRAIAYMSSGEHIQ